MDKHFIEENNLNEAVKRFREIAGYKSPRQSLNEYTFVTNSQLDEEGDEDDGELQQPQGNMQQPQGDMNQPQNMQQNAPQDIQGQGGGMNGQNGGEMPPQGSGMTQNNDMMPQGGMQQPTGDEMPMDGGQDGMQDQGMDDFGATDFNDDDVETEEMEPEDEVIDVDDLTQSQEATEYKIDGVDDRLSKIFAVVKDFSDKLDKQEQSIINLKNEFEKRNPTQTEKFNIRSQAGGPFNQSVNDYWDKVSAENPNYEIMRDNDVSPSDEQKEFEIKRGDISGLNMRNISDTLDIDQKLEDYINF